MDDQLYEFLAVHDLDNLPDGAWGQMIMDAVVMYNDLFKTKYDPFDTWHAYLVRKCEEQLRQEGELTNYT